MGLREMTEKQLTERMNALTVIAHYSKRIQLTINAELVEKTIGNDFGKITDEIQDAINCLLEDERNTTIVTFDGSDTIIDIRVKE